MTTLEELCASRSVSIEDSYLEVDCWTLYDLNGDTLTLYVETKDKQMLPIASSNGSIYKLFNRDGSVRCQTRICKTDNVMGVTFTIPASEPGKDPTILGLSYVVDDEDFRLMTSRRTQNPYLTVSIYVMETLATTDNIAKDWLNDH